MPEVFRSPIFAQPLSMRQPAGEMPLGSAISDMRDLPDETLLARICDVDREALACLYERYARLVRSVAFRILRDTSEAEDLLQDLFMFIQRKCKVFDRSKSSARSWIVQMTYHRAIERRRYLITRHFYSRQDIEGRREPAVGMPTAEGDYSAETVLARNGWEKLFESLSKDQRETLRLHFFEGFTLPEIAAQLGQPHGNVRHHYYRALKKLRKQMFGATVRANEPHGK